MRAQDNIQQRGMKQEIVSLVEQYGQARVAKDTEQLKRILTKDMDQLVSTGEWRRGIDSAMEGMLRSSTRQPGSRSLSVEEVRFINENTAIADAPLRNQKPGWYFQKHVEHFYHDRGARKMEDNRHPKYVTG